MVTTDQLSLYLFIIVTELLSRLVRKAEIGGLIEGFVPDEGVPSVPFIQFADDSFLLKADQENIGNLRCILLIMEAVSRLKVNLRKSKLYLVGKVLNMVELASIMGCEVDSFPVTYHGLPLGVKSSSKEIWNPIIE